MGVKASMSNNDIIQKIKEYSNNQHINLQSKTNKLNDKERM